MDKKVKSILFANGSLPLKKSEIIKEYKTTCKRDLEEDVKKSGYQSLVDFFEKHFHVNGDQIGLQTKEQSDSDKVKHITELVANKKKKEDYSGLRPRSTVPMPSFKSENLPKNKRPTISSSNSNLIPLGGVVGNRFSKPSSSVKAFFAPSEPQTSSSQPFKYTDHTADEFFYEEDVEDEFSLMADDLSADTRGPKLPEVRATFSGAYNHGKFEQLDQRGPCLELQQNASDIYLRVFDDFLMAVLEKARSTSGLSKETLHNLSDEFGLLDVITWDNIEPALTYFKKERTGKESGIIFSMGNSESNFTAAVDKLILIQPTEDLCATNEDCEICSKEGELFVLHPTKWANQWARLHRELFQFLSYGKTKQAPFIQLNQHYLCCSENSTFFRGQVLKIDKKGVCKILQIDHGKTLDIPADKIYQMPAHFFNFPPMVVFFLPYGRMKAEGKVRVNFQRYEYHDDMRVYYGEFAYL